MNMLRRLRLEVLLIIGCIVLSAPACMPDEATGQILGGSLSSPIRLEVFSDFQCPACRELYLQVIRQVLSEYSDQGKVCVIYHEYPLSIHQYSRRAAQYSEAASRLGRQKLLSVMDALFENQPQWAKDGSVDAVVAKALSREDYLKVRRIMQDPAIDAQIQRQTLLGIQQKVNSTPTTFIYYASTQQGKFEGFVPYDYVKKQVIDKHLK